MAQRIITDPLATRDIFRQLAQGTLRNSVKKGILKNVLHTKDT
jgi:hypothetical protein